MIKGSIGQEEIATIYIYASKKFQNTGVKTKRKRQIHNYSQTFQHLAVIFFPKKEWKRQKERETLM